MRPGIIYAVLCATCFGFWTILHSAASRQVSSALGAILVSGSAVLVLYIHLYTLYTLYTSAGLLLSVSEPQGTGVHPESC